MTLRDRARIARWAAVAAVAADAVADAVIAADAVADAVIAAADAIRPSFQPHRLN